MHESLPNALVRRPGCVCFFALINLSIVLFCKDAIAKAVGHPVTFMMDVVAELGKCANQVCIKNVCVRACV